jgi:hypothetical protein
VCRAGRLDLEEVGVQVIGSQFTGSGVKGDFGWMIEQPEWKDDTLFIFNDNEQQFREFVDKRQGGCDAGQNNAVIRPYQCPPYDPPRAAGIPTGDGGGYPALTDHVKAVIDEAIGIIKNRLATGHYKRVVYSAANAQGDLGVGIYNPAKEVKQYIVSELRKLAN